MAFYYQDDGTGVYAQRGLLTAIITAVASILMLFVATAKLWFSHLWYRNSTHKRHHELKHHERHQPVRPYSNKQKRR